MLRAFFCVLFTLCFEVNDTIFNGLVCNGCKSLAINYILFLKKGGKHMLKRFNLLVLAILLVSQTILSPIVSVNTVFAEASNEERANEQSISNLEEELLDISKLELILEDIEGLEENDYTEESYAALINVVEESKMLLQDETSTQEELNAAVKEIEEALENLTGQSKNDSMGEDNASESDDAILENDNVSEKDTDELVEEVPQKTNAMSAKEESRAASEMGNEFFDFKISEVMDLQGNPYNENNPLKPDDEFWVKVDWELKDGHKYIDGDTVTFQLPDELHVNGDLDSELKDNLGNQVATYTITPAGVVTLTFTDFVETHNSVTGWIEIRAELDQDVVREDDGNIVIGPIEDEGSQVIPIDRSPINKTVEKQGKLNKSYNADEIEWTVTINKNAISLKGVTLEDLLPNGTEYVEDSLEVVKQAATLNGTPVGEKTKVSVTSSDADGKLSIPLGNIEDVYTLTYKTKVTDLEEKNFKNTVRSEEHTSELQSRGHL